MLRHTSREPSAALMKAITGETERMMNISIEKRRYLICVNTWE